MKSVVVLGASTNPDRYAFKAMQRLQEHGYKAIPVNPAFEEVLGERCYPLFRLDSASLMRSSFLATILPGLTNRAAG